MRGALSPRVKKIHQSYYLPMTTAMAVALFEEPMQKRARLEKSECAHLA